MKKYIADALTAIRFLSAVVLTVLVFGNQPHAWALWVFVAGELTDAFDGIAARKWPFDPAHTPRYRQYAELYDMVTDVFLGLAALAYLSVRIDPLAGSVFAIIIICSALFVDFLVWGQPFGAPQRHLGYCLWRTKPQRAEKLILFRRRLYAVAIAIIIIVLLIHSDYSCRIKLALIMTAFVAAIILLILKQDRLHEIKTK